MLTLLTALLLSWNDMTVLEPGCAAYVPGLKLDSFSTTWYCE